MDKKNVKHIIRFSIAGLFIMGLALWCMLYFRSIPSTARAGEQIVAKINAGLVSDMYGYQFELHYDKTDFEYIGGISSSIPEISTIFAKEFDTHLLVGATMIGAENGVSANKADICEITLIANNDCDLSGISVASVNVVQSDLSYHEDVMDWILSTMVKGQVGFNNTGAFD